MCVVINAPTCVVADAIADDMFDALRGAPAAGPNGESIGESSYVMVDESIAEKTDGTSCVPMCEPIVDSNVESARALVAESFAGPSDESNDVSAVCAEGVR